MSAHTLLVNQTNFHFSPQTTNSKLALFTASLARHMGLTYSYWSYLQCLIACPSELQMSAPKPITTNQNPEQINKPKSLNWRYCTAMQVSVQKGGNVGSNARNVSCIPECLIIWKWRSPPYFLLTTQSSSNNITIRSSFWLPWCLVNHHISVKGDAAGHMLASLHSCFTTCLLHCMFALWHACFTLCLLHCMFAFRTGLLWL